ncbi:adenylate/guanylate cyclase domain-containing protein [Leptolyngbyaceae cyanobacterium UHCC 1019]
MWDNLKQLFERSQGVLLTASVAGALIALRFGGGLQLLEWAAFDQFAEWAPAAPVDPRIVIVGITEADIAKYQWPVSDQVLATLLTKVKQQQPKAIGLDLYRNLPIEPGHSQLVKVFETTPNLVGVRMVGNAAGSVDPPTSLNPQNQVGASDIVLDSDGKVRRSLLTLKDSQDQTVVGIGTKLALTYLAKQGINLESVNTEQNQYQLGKASFTPLKPFDGGYVNADAGGYQILSTFCRSRKGFHTLSMDDLLQGTSTIPLQNTVVLIGVTAESAGDLFSAPCSDEITSRSTTKAAGVEIHASITSQILSAALDGKSLIRVWAEPIEILWICLWAGIGGIVGLRLRSPRWVLMSVFLLGGGLVGGTYIAFLGGWWIPVVPPLLALTGVAVGNNGLMLWKNLRFSYGQLAEYSRSLEQRVRDRTVELSQKNTQLEQEVQERLRTETALSTSEQYLRIILNNIPQQVFWKDTTLTFLGCNKNWAESAGLETPDAIVGKTDYDVLPSADLADQFRSQDSRIINTDMPELHMVARKVRQSADGQDRWLDISKLPIHDLQGNVIGLLGVIEDITQRKQAEEALKIEQEKSERLLLNILPEEIAEQLKQGQSAIATRFDEVTILFSDIVDFTGLASRLSPTDLVSLLNEIFSAFDHLAEQYGVEKIKTIGDAYMAVCGLPVPRADHADAIAAMALDMQQAIAHFKTDLGDPFRIRIGINTGPVVAAVIGIKKFSYDLWGDAVNIASRMETHSIPGEIQVTEATYEHLKDKYKFTDRGTIAVKGRGDMKTYFLTGK